ncbi:MAG: ATP-binding cassette domain-containing protein [Nitrospinae bacterium]|nr:ATP-binding cassette domain-containing protein [Nitrospinota bacterium]
MIEVEGLTKTYGEARGIDNISFHVERGEILGFLGPNGAGKTTTMRILTCFMPATGGKATVAGYDIFEESLKVRSRIGYLPETVPLYTDMQPPSYLAFVAGLKGLPYRRIKPRVEEVMEQVGLTHMAHKYIGELSKGYRQRVGLAQALINDPEVLILDEPTIGLDPKQIVEIRSLIKGLGGERTIILSSHILPEVSMVCERLIIIDEGKVKAMDTTANLLKGMGTAVRVEARIGGPADEVEKELGALAGVRVVTRTAPSNGELAARYLVEFANGDGGGHLISRLAARHAWDLYELIPAKLTLEDIFIKVVTKEEGVAS